MLFKNPIKGALVINIAGEGACQWNVFTLELQEDKSEPDRREKRQYTRYNDERIQMVLAAGSVQPYTARRY